MRADAPLAGAPSKCHGRRVREEASYDVSEKSSSPGRRHQVVIVGSGFGGLFAAKALRRADVDVTLIARTSHHLFQPLLYQVATGVLSQGEIAPATREILMRQKNVRVVLGDVTAIDLEHRTVTSQVVQRTFVREYDTLILAAGAGQSYFGNDQFADFAPGMKSIDDALELRARIFGAFENAELSDDPDERRRLMTFVVVGAGPTGVEMAGQIAELAHRALLDEYRRIDTRDARIVLLDGAPQVLPSFGEKLGRKAAAKLEKLGVEVRTGTLVTDVDAHGIRLKDPDGTEERIESETKIWAAGVSASPLARMVGEQSGAEVDRAGRVEVLPDLTLPGHPEVFVIGDMMTRDELPGVAQVAIQGGKYAAKRIVARLEDRADDKPFHYFDKGNMATVSRFNAAADIGKLKLFGFVAWLLWLGVHLFYITGFKNRLTTLLHWAVSFVGKDRSERATTEQQAVARRALEMLGADVHEIRPAARLRPGRDDSPRERAAEVDEGVEAVAQAEDGADRTS
jgi:NADH dehydrogenase